MVVLSLSLFLLLSLALSLRVSKTNHRDQTDDGEDSRKIATRADHMDLQHEKRPGRLTGSEGNFSITRVDRGCKQHRTDHSTGWNRLARSLRGRTRHPAPVGRDSILRPAPAPGQDRPQSLAFQKLADDIRRTLVRSHVVDGCDVGM